MDPITDIFRTMHVTAFGQHRLEATAPWGLIQDKRTEEKVTPSDKKMSPTDLAHFAMLSRGNCWLSVEGIPEPIPLTGGDFMLLARGTGWPRFSWSPNESPIPPVISVIPHRVNVAYK